MIELTGLDTQLITQIIALIAAVVALLKHEQVKVLTQTGLVSETLQKTIVATLPSRSYKMDEGVKRWAMSDCPPSVAADICAQITAAEAEKKLEYYIHFPGGYYLIQYGLIHSASGNCSGLKQSS